MFYFETIGIFMARLEISRNGLELIESFEGFRARAIRLSNGKYTIGFGHTATAREGMVVNREQAEELLRWDLGPIEDFIRQNTLTPLNQNQFDAIVSFVFNIGLEDFKNSEILRHLNRGEPVAAAIALSAWRNAHLNGQNIVVDALVRRRALEASMFLDTLGPRPAAPSSVIKPLLDYRASLLAPKAENIKEISFEKANGEAIIKEEVQIPPAEILPIELPQSKKDEILAEALLDNNDTQNDNLVPFPVEMSRQNEIENNISNLKIANEVKNEIEIPANDLQINKQNIALNDEKPVLVESGKLKNIISKKSIDPVTIFVIFAGLIAFIAGLYEAIGQNIFKNGLYQLGQNQAHVFIALTLAIGLAASILGLISLFFNEKE